MSFPIYLINSEKGIYVKINSIDGDGLVVDPNFESISAGCKEALTHLATMTDVQRVLNGYAPLAENDFIDFKVSVQERINKQANKR